MGFQMISCEDQYQKFPQINRNEVLELMKWQETQPHLPTVSEIEAIFFLHSCKCDLQAAKKCLDLYYTVRTMCPEFFANRNGFGDDFFKSMKVFGVTLLPGLTKEGYRVFFVNFIDPDASKFEFLSTVKLFSIVFDFWLAKEGVCEGFIVVFDMTGFSFSHLKKMKYFALKKTLYYIQECLPIRLISIHYINGPSIMDAFLALIKPFMKKELIEANVVHKSFDTLLDVHVSKSMMPNGQYGGSAGSLSEMFKKTMDPILANEQFFVEDDATKRVNEKLRPGKPKTERDIFGYLSALFSGSRNRS